MIEELSRRYTATLGGPGAATLTFDAGQNSAPNFTRLGELGLHFVGSVPPSDHPGLLARPATDRHLVPAYAEEHLTAFEDTAMVLGQRRRVILTHSVGRTPPSRPVRPDPAQGHRRADRAGRPAGPRPHPPPTLEGQAASTPSAHPAGSPE